jgi:recombination protein RecR
MLPQSLQKLINNLAKLPGVGKKTAQRYAYFLLREHRSLANEIGSSLIELQNEVKLCKECFMIADSELCGICVNRRRDRNSICVVEHIFDVEAIERSGEHHGVYHVLHGRISPLDKMTPEDLKINELFVRIQRLQETNSASATGAVAIEIILATNPSSEGETTAFYLQKLLKPLDVKITRIATGIPVGADLEYADEVTLARALKGRQNYD